MHAIPTPPAIVQQETVSGPLTRFRQTHEPSQDVAQAVPDVLPDQFTMWTVGNAGNAPAFRSKAEAKQLADHFNRSRPADAPKAVLVRLVVSPSDHPSQDDGVAMRFARNVTLTFPKTLWTTFLKRCGIAGMDAEELMAALLLWHLQQRGPDNFGQGMVRNFESWLKGNRSRFYPWPDQPDKQVEVSR